MNSVIGTKVEAYSLSHLAKVLEVKVTCIFNKLNPLPDELFSVEVTFSLYMN